MYATEPWDAPTPLRWARGARSGAIDATAIEIVGLSIGFPGQQGGRRFALEVSALEVEPGECLLVQGDSGSGKSTLFSYLSLNRTLGPEHARRFRFRGKDLLGLDDSLLSATRAWSIGFIFQDAALYDDRSGLANVEEPLRRLYPRWQAARRSDLAHQALEMFFTDRDQLERVVSSQASLLSGGERQRVSLARAIVHRPAVLFADEPTTGLDPVNVDLLRAMLLALQAEGVTLFLISHDQNFLANLRADQARLGLVTTSRWLWPTDPRRPWVRTLCERPPLDRSANFQLGSVWRHSDALCLHCGSTAESGGGRCRECGFSREPAQRGCPRCGKSAGGDFCAWCRAPLFPIYGAAER